MIRILVVVALLSIMTTSPSRADIFKCKLPDGSTFFTDSRELATADCKLERVESLPVLGIIHGDFSAPTTSPYSASSSPSGRKSQDVKTFEAFKSEVDLLAEHSSPRGAGRGVAEFPISWMPGES